MDIRSNDCRLDRSASESFCHPGENARALHRLYKLQWLKSCKLYPKTQILCSPYCTHQSPARTLPPKGKAGVSSFSCISLQRYCCQVWHPLPAHRLKSVLIYRTVSSENTDSKPVFIYSTTTQENKKRKKNTSPHFLHL